jgi:hypothetical protein
MNALKRECRTRQSEEELIMSENENANVAETSRVSDTPEVSEAEKAEPDEAQAASAAPEVGSPQPEPGPSERPKAEPAKEKKTGSPDSHRTFERTPSIAAPGLHPLRRVSQLVSGV